MSRNPMPAGRRDEILERDGYKCQMFRHPEFDTRIVGCTWKLETHHRRARGMGGTSDPSIHDPENLVTLCSLHHAEVESRRADAYECGLLIRR